MKSNDFEILYKIFLKCGLSEKTYLNRGNKQEFNSFYVYHGDTIDGHQQTTNH